MLWAAWALLALCGAGARAAWAPGGACPRLYRKQFHGYTPIGNLTAGNYTEQPSLKVLGQCIMGCCVSETCNVVFKVDDKCYHVECYSNELCMPLLRTESPKVGTHASMILVKPVLPNENWEDILANYREQSISSNLSPKDDMDPYTNDRHDLILDDDEQERLSLSRLLNLPDIDEIEHRARVMHPNDYYDPNELDIAKICEIRSDTDCPLHAQCNAITLRSRKGICQCKPGYKENSNGDCVPMFSKNSAEQGEEMDIPRLLKEATKPDISSERSIQKLTVSIESKQIELPENKVTLSAYTIPDEKATMSHYNYAWTLVDQPKEGFTGNMNQNGGMVTLTDLTEGQYRFKVTVNGTNSFGEGFANVTVLPAERINKPPQVVITPVTQTVKMPNTGAVLDGSASKDDDHIISWHWEVASGPIGYQPPLQEGSTLVLTDLKQPGNYTFKLTVEDSDHVKNSTTANITVLSHADYPPEANAGEDVIVYLPNNKLTLNGSLSTDDHEITSWEWTKAAEDANKAVDMQNTHSPYLQLSNLSEGAYAFVLKVTDSSGQSSTAEVHVFVKPATNTPPVADAGPDQFISLPQTWAILNGSTSHDDHRIVAYTWSYLSGPTNSNILLYNESIANATALTKGEYMFKLTVLDDSGNSATDNVTVTVTQNKNSPPKADGGGDQTLSLPVPVLILNGSRSSDDFRIVSYKWTRSGSGMAAGKVILDSDTKPVLMLTNIVPGRYVFELMVTDDQGAADRDTVSVQVKPNPLEQHLLEMTLNAPVSSFTQSQLDSSMQKLQLLLKEGIKINITDVRVELDSDNTQIVFYLYEQTTPVEGRRALALVRGAGWGAGGGAAGGAVVARLRSVRCLSTCSGRGACDQQTRSCRCDAFWMQNLFTQYDPEAQPNCDWSVVYASLGTVGTMATAAAACWGVTRGARRLCAAVRRPSAPRTKYRLLTPSNHEDIPFTSNNISDTETDSDVLFESKNSTFLSNRLLNGELPQLQGSSKKNGHFKSSRKVKT